MTKLNYLEDTHLFEAEATFLETKNHEKGTAVILDGTIFYPQGGGQPADQGKISTPNATFTVNDVRLDEDGTVWHFGIFENGEFQKGEKIKHKVIMYLSQDTDVNYHLELFLVELAGNLKLRETVPYLFRILIDSDFRDLVRSSCSISLGQIGTPEVVEKIGSLYRSYKDLKNVLAETFKYIPYDYSEEMAVQLLKSETDPETGTFLAGALCDIFSIKSSDMIIDIIRKKQYDPSIMGLLDYLIPVYVYHNKTIDNLAELERREREFQDERLDTHPLFKLRKHPKLSKDHDEIEDEESDSFDEDDIEDIEDSRERKKVMPMSRIPSKKRNKSKKKKKKSRKR